MAFVFQAKRDFTYAKKKDLSLGPGAYIGHEEYKLGKAQVPFSSTSVRDFSMGKNGKISPGPGTYELPLKRKPKIDQFGRAKCSSSFASSLNRFNAGNTGLNPGPGSYNIDRSLPTHVAKGKSQQKPRVLNNFPSVPSIPTQSQAYGYDETLSGELISQKNPNQLHSGLPGDHIGPGHYNPKKITQSLGTIWHKSNSRRELIPSTSSNNIGPGSYSANQGQSMYKLKTSAVFASTCKRDAGIPMDDYDYESTEVDRDGNPGPGQYFYKDSSFVNKENKVQKFGIKSKRFENKFSEVPGPGYYNPEGEVQVVSGMKAPFASTDPRFAAKNTVTPGPGAYIEPQDKEVKVKRNLLRDGAFGSSEKRFPSSGKLEVPGPGYYENHNRIGIHNSASNKPFSVFSSKVERNPRTEEPTPAPGNYEIPSGFDKKEHFSAVVVVKVKEGVDKLLGFNCKDTRWKEKNSEIPGPGTYYKKNQAKGKLDKKKKNFFSKEKRFPNNFNDLPGPGTYIEPTGYWNKKTFNIQFGEFEKL